MKLWSIGADGKLHLHLHPAQAALWRSARRFLFFIAGTQSGKTSFGPWWLWREIKRRGAGDYLAATASFDLFKLKMLPEIRTVFEHVLGIGRYWAGDRILELIDPQTGKFWATRADDPMWGRIILRSAQSEGGLESATAQAAWLDEVGQDDFSLMAWEAVQRRLSLSLGRVLGTTTPYNLGWLKSQVFDRWRAGDPDYFVVQAESTINPAFPTAEFERARRTLTEWKFRMLYGGEFARPAALIYSDFDDRLGGNLVAPFSIPVAWPRYVGLDFGPVHTAMCWLAYNPETEAYYWYREYLEGGKSTPEHAQVFKDHAAHERVVRVQGGAKSEEQYRMDWSVAEVSVGEPEIVDVEAGIDRGIQLVKSKRLFVFEDCKGARDEFGTYARELDENGQPTDKIKHKERFHLLDAYRYIAQTLVGGTEAYGETVNAYQPTISASPY